MEDRTTLTPDQVILLLGICLCTYFVYCVPWPVLQADWWGSNGIFCVSRCDRHLYGTHQGKSNQHLTITGEILEEIHGWHCFLQRSDMKGAFSSPELHISIHQVYSRARGEWKLLFLDVLIMRKDDGQLEIGACHKKQTPTDTCTWWGDNGIFCLTTVASSRLSTNVDRT